ncbi:hypothetical protein PR202_ga19974 [Eleusine coracana subsp. coracana]|uniref:KIB1-4 beta-propeller domain-containing protein n=1 Tax=Eleusine coracana subsp. coracana TaxID=191504 RepID=A0AAV5CW76_ELECO|nr:hypothetical protein PR202_ga19974 [Eleusine coracana subsp. coracana]
MAAFRPWADLPPELLLFISDGFGLPFESYCSIRGVCTAWRAVLPSPIPSLISVEIPKAPLIQQSKQVHALSLTAQHSFPLATIRVDGQCLGSSNGWLAIQSPVGIFLLNPFGGEKVQLLPLRNDDKPVSKIVFAPNPTPEDYVAVAICDLRRLAYTKTRDMKWMIVDVAMDNSDHLVDLAYDVDAGKVYCVTICGNVHVLHIPRRQRRRPLVEPLQAGCAGHPFDPASVYAPPYDTASRFTGFKRIFFVGGSLYQLWRNTTSTVSWTMPGGGRFRMTKDQVFVFKYDQGRVPCWNTVKDLGGCSVFIGKNNPAVLRADDVPGVRANCVYWIDEWSRNEPMVFDMATGTSTLHPAATSVPNPGFRTICWYFMNDNNMSVSSNGRKRPSSEQDCGQTLKIQKFELVLASIGIIHGHEISTTLVWNIKAGTSSELPVLSKKSFGSNSAVQLVKEYLLLNVANTKPIQSSKMPEFRDDMGTAFPDLSTGGGGFFIRRVASPGTLAVRGARKPHARRFLSPSNNKENRPPVWAVRATPPKRRSPLPDWYPRTPLRDITAIAKAIQRSRLRIAAAQQESQRPEQSPQSVNVATPAQVEDIPRSSEASQAVASGSGSAERENVASPATILAQENLKVSSSLAESSLKTPFKPMDPALADVVEKKLSSSISQIEKMVKKNMKRTPKAAQPSKRALQRRALMSMR